MKKEEIYLAGKFNLSTPDKIFNWREDVKSHLEDYYTLNDPARLLTKDCFKNDRFHEPKGEKSSKEIFCSDLYLLNKSDIVLCHLDKGNNTLGLWWEIGYAYSQNKLIILSGNDKEDYYGHPFIIQSCIRYNNLEDTIDYLLSLTSSII